MKKNVCKVGAVAMTRRHLTLSLVLMASSSLCFATYPALVMPNTIQMYAEMSKQLNDQAEHDINQLDKEIAQIQEQLNGECYA